MMNIDKRLIRLLKNLKWPLGLTITFALISSIAIVFQAFYLSFLIDASFLKHQTVQKLFRPFLLFVIFLLVRFVTQWLSDAFASHLSSKIRFDLRNRLVHHLQQTSPVFLTLEKRGELSNTLQQGVEALDAYFRLYIPQLFKAVALPLIILFFVFPLDWLSGLVFLFTAPIIPIFMILIGLQAKNATQKQWKTLSYLSAYLLDMIEGLTTLKILNRSRSQFSRIRTLSEQFRQSTMHVLRIAFLSALILELAASISTAVIAVEIGLRLLYAKLPFSEALFILILAPEFYQPMRQLGASFHAGMEGIEAAKRIFELFTIPQRNTSNSKVQKKVNQPLIIEFNQVFFRYSESQEPALQNLSLKFESGKKHVIVGPSGSGKSTIFNLLLKFIKPTNGEILINGTNLQQIDEEFWFSQISWVGQNPYLFHDSIENNLKLVKPNATIQQITEACQKARLHELIQQLDHGYQTTVGERGIRLSAGQAQRLALARAFLKDAPIVLLDEPTANLDPELDREISEIMEQFPPTKMQILIAHRFTTLKKADQIFALVNGQLVDQGRFVDLMQPGRYLHQLVKNLKVKA